MKPVIGVGDGLSSVMHGISNEVSNQGNEDAVVGTRQIRPRRTFQYSSVGNFMLFLSPRALCYSTTAL